jgi:DNA-binding transcriptional ArsR family regulator
MKKKQLTRRNSGFSGKIDEKIIALLSNGKRRTAYEIGSALNIHWSLALSRLSLLSINKKVEEIREGNIVYFSIGP